MPNALCRLAAQAALAHGVEKTAKHLQIKPERLQRWIDQFGLADHASAPTVLTQFVELPPLLGGPLAECQLEIEEPSGRKLRLCFKGPALAQAALLIPAIWSAPQP